MDNAISAAELAFDMLHEVLGEYAPRKRRLLLDFKDGSGQDRNTDTIAWHNRNTADEAVIEMLKTQIASEGGTLSAVTELLENEKVCCLYCVPGFIEESIHEWGIPVPNDMKAAMENAGFHPINWDELVQHWKKG